MGQRLVSDGSHVSHGLDHGWLKVSYIRGADVFWICYRWLIDESLNLSK